MAGAVQRAEQHLEDDLVRVASHFSEEALLIGVTLSSASREPVQCDVNPQAAVGDAVRSALGLRNGSFEALLGDTAVDLSASFEEQGIEVFACAPTSAHSILISVVPTP